MRESKRALIGHNESATVPEIEADHIDPVDVEEE